jgi:hypothetical protein
MTPPNFTTKGQGLCGLQMAASSSPSSSSTSFYTTGSDTSSSSSTSCYTTECDYKGSSSASSTSCHTTGSRYRYITEHTLRHRRPYQNNLDSKGQATSTGCDYRSCLSNPSTHPPSSSTKINEINDDIDIAYSIALYDWLLDGLGDKILRHFKEIEDTYLRRIVACDKKRLNRPKIGHTR